MSEDVTYTLQQYCRVCSSKMLILVHDFGNVPLADKLAISADEKVPNAPLSLSFCNHCGHVQINENVNPVLLFKEKYPYFSSKIPELHKHFQEYALKIGDRYQLNSSDSIIEIACNDGLLLEYLRPFTSKLIGIEPSEDPATDCLSKGIPCIPSFFDKAFAEKFVRQLDDKPRIILANNVLAHVPDPVDFVQGISLLCDEQTVVILEVPHLLPIVNNRTFDVIFHQHYSYFSLHVLMQLWANQGFHLHHVEQIDTQGGSLRLHWRLSAQADLPPQALEILSQEQAAGLQHLETFQKFSEALFLLKNSLMNCLMILKQEGKRVAAYGAPGKAATLLNYFGINRDYILWIADISPLKQGKYFPNANIPIVSPEFLEESTPDYLLILSWNYATSIMQQWARLKDKGMRFILPFPSTTII